MTKASLSISSKNYSSWALRGWLLCKMVGLEFDEERVPTDVPWMRAELLLASPSFLVPRLTHDGAIVWDTLAIAEYLNETFPDARLLPSDRQARAHCRAICGEMHAGFAHLRSALPMNLRAHYPDFPVWAEVQADIDRIAAIWQQCFATYHGPYLFGELSMADAMYAPVCARFFSYDVMLDDQCAAYSRRILKWPLLQEWIAAAKLEADEMEELDAVVTMVQETGG
jgi:glutathione S-transferase